MADAGLAVALVLVGLSAILWTFKHFNAWWYLPRGLGKDVKMPPGDLGWPLIGEMVDFLWWFKSEPDVFMERKHAKYNGAGIYTSHLFGGPCILTCAPEFNKFVLGSGSDSFTVGWPSPRLVGPSSLVSVEGDQHARLRRYLKDVISNPRSLETLLGGHEERIKSMLADWARRGTINLRDETKSFALKSICETLVSLKEGKVIEDMEEDFAQLMRGLRAYPIDIPGFAHYDALQSRKRLTTIVQSIIDSRRTTPGNVHKDFLYSLMEAVDSIGVKLTDQELNDNIVSLLLGGHESTAYTIMWIMIFLAQHQAAVLEKLSDEHRAIRERKKEGEHITLDDIRQMTYTNLVIDETLRVVNISPFIFRTVAKDVHYKGFFFPKGWKVLVWIRAPHMDATLFENPRQFDPDRLKNFVAKRGVFQPFGYGQRLCPGNQFAKIRTCLFVHHLVLNYKWELVDPNSKVTYLPHAKPKDGGVIRFRHL